MSAQKGCVWIPPNHQVPRLFTTVPIVTDFKIMSVDNIPVMGIYVDYDLDR